MQEGLWKGARQFRGNYSETRYDPCHLLWLRQLHAICVKLQYVKCNIEGAPFTLCKRVRKKCYDLISESAFSRPASSVSCNAYLTSRSIDMFKKIKSVFTEQCYLLSCMVCVCLVLVCFLWCYLSMFALLFEIFSFFSASILTRTPWQNINCISIGPFWLNKRIN